MKTHIHTSYRFIFLLMFGLFAYLPSSFGHASHGEAGGFATGFAHPIGGWDHILAMVAVGLWSAQLGRPLVWVLPIAFPMMMAVGAAMGIMGIPLPFVEIGIAVSAIALGALVMFQKKLPIPAAIAIVGFFALFHGHAHGTELPGGTSGLMYSIGFVISTGLLHALGIAIGLIHYWNPGKLVLRGLGTAVACGGIFFLLGATGVIA